MKKALLFLCLFVFSTAFAQAPVSVPPQEQVQTLCAQDTVQVTLKFDALAMAGVQEQLVWDPQVFELAQKAPAFIPEFKKGSMVAMLNPDAQLGTLNLVYLRMEDASLEDAAAVTFELNVRQDAPAGETCIGIRDFQMTNAKAEPVDSLTEDKMLLVLETRPTPEVSPAPTEEPLQPETPVGPTEEPLQPETPVGPTEEPLQPETSVSPAPDAEMRPNAYVDVVVIPYAQTTPEGTAVPAPTATARPTATVRPAVTSTPVPTQKPPASSTGSTIVSRPDPTAAPTAVPSPVPTKVVLESVAPPMREDNSMGLRTRRTEKGFAVDLWADGITIGGLQGTIVYDASAAAYIQSAFSGDFQSKAIMSMINDQTPGELRLVYSSMDGFQADSSVLFTAEFECDAASTVQIALKDAKCTDASAALNSWTYAQQNYRVQPMDDLTVFEDVMDTLRLSGGTFTHVLNAGDSAWLLLEKDVVWTSSAEEIVSVDADGIATAHRSGAAELVARDVRTGDVVACGMLCVRNLLYGLPVEVHGMEIRHSGQTVFALKSDDENGEAFQKRGLKLIYSVSDDEETVVICTVPEGMTVIPGKAFLGSDRLVCVEVCGTEITQIQSDAFAGCPELQRIKLSKWVMQLEEDALRCDEPVTVNVCAGSSAERLVRQLMTPLVSVEVTNE